MLLISLIMYVSACYQNWAWLRQVSYTRDMYCDLGGVAIMFIYHLSIRCEITLRADTPGHTLVQRIPLSPYVNKNRKAKRRTRVH